MRLGAAMKDDSPVGGPQSFGGAKVCHLLPVPAPGACSPPRPVDSLDRPAPEAPLSLEPHDLVGTDGDMRKLAAGRAAQANATCAGSSPTWPVSGSSGAVRGWR